MVRRWNLMNLVTIDSIHAAAASVYADFAGHIYLYPCAEGNSECAPIGF